MIPLTATPSRFSTILAFFFLGMMTDGVARWNFDSVLETPQQISQGGTSGSILPAFNMTLFNATMSAAAIASAKAQVASLSSDVIMNVTLVWDPIPANISLYFNGFALLVDDGW